ncbi:unnamed protein product [Haemonchus placei]|uniref:Glycine rich protein n=1 Tax=Haemonchus placei TaxID=6290 RepID=A0A0N4WL62_HAEPC|nr:unnamed protein product [Haemonchus placei]
MYISRVDRHEDRLPIHCNPNKKMSTFAFLALAALFNAVSAHGQEKTLSTAFRLAYNSSKRKPRLEYGFGYGEYGAGHHGHDHDSKYGTGYTKGFDTGGYGDYGSHKYGGWGSYAKGKEHGSYYGKSLSVY